VDAGQVPEAIALADEARAMARTQGARGLQARALRLLGDAGVAAAPTNSRRGRGLPGRRSRWPNAWRCARWWGGRAGAGRTVPAGGPRGPGSRGVHARRRGVRGHRHGPLATTFVAGPASLTPRGAPRHTVAASDPALTDAEDVS
jgi:hypothetical protein